MADLMKDDIIQPIIDYAAPKIQEDNNPKDIYIGLLSLGAIVIGPNKRTLTQKFSDALSVLFNLLEHRNGKIRETTGWLISLLGSECPDLFDRENVFKELVGIILNLLVKDEKTGSQLCIFLSNFSKNIQP